MKIMISDYKDSMMPDHAYEMEVLRAGIPEAEIVVYEYTDEKREEFLDRVADIDALLTAFIKIDKVVFARARQLKVISINATGYDNVDMGEATRNTVGVCPVGEYCTHDVAEHTMALMLALNKNLKAYTSDIEQRYRWKYDFPPVPNRIENQTLGIFGLGKIGKRVAYLAQGLGMTVIATDPAVSPDVARQLGVELVTPDEIYSRADVISNHMNLEHTNVAYFTAAEFSRMVRTPIFLNLGRGLSVNEDDLARALDSGKIRAVGVDVLTDETPHLQGHQLAGRDNVIITPHSAFYSTQSMQDLQRISCENIVHYLLGSKDKVYRLVNEL